MVLAVRKLPANAGVVRDTGFWKIPRSRKWQTTPVFLPGESHGQRSLVAYSPWGRRESDLTKAIKHACTVAIIITLLPLLLLIGTLR